MEPSPGYHGLNFVATFGDIAYILYVRMAILRDGGPCLNPFATSFALAGLGNLSPRIDRHNSNALSLATWLETNEKVAKVIYPGLESHRTFGRATKYLRQKNGSGAVLYFNVTARLEKLANLTSNLRLIKSGPGYAFTDYPSVTRP